MEKIRDIKEWTKKGVRQVDKYIIKKDTQNAN